jgi:hypothetical protein
MLKEKVPNLIAAWDTAHRVTSPSSSLLVEEPVARTRLERFSLLSSRREYWDCAVCALGFAEVKSIDVNDLIRDAASTIDADVVPSRVSEFFDYCSEMSSLDREPLLAAANAISNVLGVVTLDPRLLMDFETCFDLCGDNESCMTTCLANKVKTYG